jgi:sec-independent protein translocase protein TatC
MKFKFAGRSSAEMPFLDHLEELRWRILWSLLALLVTTFGAFAFVYYVDVIGVLMAPIRPYLPNGKLAYLAVTDPFVILIKLALAIGFVLASPIVIYQAWAFLSPALLPREKRAIIPALYLGLILFAAGAALAYFVGVPLTIQFMLGLKVESLTPNITAGFYFGFVIKMLLAFGAIFEMPVIVLVLASIGLVTSNFLRSKRRYAIAAMAVIAAMITPGDAITVTVLMMGPLLLLYELSIGLARLVERGRERAAAAADAESSDALPEAT